MIGVVDVEVQAANPQIPLYPFRAFVNSPSSVRVRNVPTEIGAWKIMSVRVVVAYPDSSIKTSDCVLAGSVWVATVAGCAVSGTAENGFTVFASGVDENGSAVSNYCLGKGNVEILKADGTLSPDAPSYYVHLFDEEPTAPNEGDMWPTSGGFVIWHDGEAHGSITVDFALSATSENPVQNKVVTAAVNARPTKAQMDEGWWSEWTVSPSAPVGKRFYFEFSSSGQWNVFLGDEGGLDPSLPPTITITPATGEETELQFDEDSIEYTATRHRVAAPVPTKPEDIGAQPQGDYYQKPSDGIPVTDLASAVQASLGLADTAVQPSGIAAKMPMYSFSEPTMAQTGDWTFSGTPAASGYHWEVEWNTAVSRWYLYEVADGTVRTDADKVGKIMGIDTDGSEASLSGFISTYDDSDILVTATRGYVCTLSPFTDSQIEIGKWMFTGTPAGDGFHYDVIYSDIDDAWTLYKVNDSTYESEDIDGVESSSQGDDVILDFENAGVTATRPPSKFEIAVGALPTGVTGKARDCILVIDCTATGAVAPTVTWDTHFHPRTDTATDLAIVEAGKRAVFYISEYAAGEFAVGGWQETAGGSGT